MKGKDKEKDWSAFEKKIGVSFKDKRFLTYAFVHRSYINENPKIELPHNERLEFLGDAVMELIVTDWLFRSYPDVDEGMLTSYRAALVNAVMLSQVATDIGMNDYLLLSKGEAKDTGKARQDILANTFEAVVGAIYMDSGYAAAKDFITRVLTPRIEEIIAKRLWQDAKSHFQEEAQEKEGVTPSYKVIAETGPDHDKKFDVGVYLGKEMLAKGTGRSKQDAEQDAARAALAKKGW